MRVCLIVEGAYPYVTGGVSSWIQDIKMCIRDRKRTVSGGDGPQTQKGEA